MRTNNYKPINTMTRKEIYLKKNDAVEEDSPDDKCAYIDLGLPSGALWASCNVGSSKPESYGEYYTYDEAVVLPEIEIPTIEDWKELLENCTCEWTTINGISGRKVIGKNGNSIFLPAAGDRNGTSISNAGAFGYYWSSSLDARDQGYAWGVDFGPVDVCRYGGYRRYGGRSARHIKRQEKL